MARTRDAKKAARDARDDARHARRRQRLVEMLRGLGLTTITTREADLILERRYPEPEVVLSPDAAARAGSADLLAIVRREVEGGSVQLAPDDVVVSLVDFFAHYHFVAGACHPDGSERQGIGGFADFAALVWPHVEENLRRGQTELLRRIHTALLARSSFCSDIFYPRMSEVEASPGRWRIRALIEVHRAERVTFVRDDKPRPAWRCGLGSDGSEMDWVIWTPGAEDMPPDVPPGDLYIQSHALERLRERLCVSNPQALESWVVCSLREPKIIPDGAGWLVEFRVGPWRLGYLRAERIDGKILVTTFLFITNAGTPEGRRLRALTRFKTDEISWLRMDQLSYFTFSDVTHDRELRAIFIECGCGHLFEMGKLPEGFAPLARAQETRRHLDLPLAPKIRAPPA